MKILFSYMSAISLCLLTPPLSAQDANPLIGRWRWESLKCENADFVFSQTKFIRNSDADGARIQIVYDNIRYTISENSVSVDLNKNHGFGKTPEKTKLTFRIVDKNHLVMDRKTKSMTDIFRCP